jgi:hypothetical protein
MSAPANGYLGTNQLFKEGDLVMYSATPYWFATRGMWHDIEGKVGEVVEVVYNSTYTHSPLADIHPFSYRVLFNTDHHALMPAPENLHPASGKESTWEL